VKSADAFTTPRSSAAVRAGGRLPAEAAGDLTSARVRRPVCSDHSPNCVTDQNAVVSGGVVKQANRSKSPSRKAEHPRWRARLAVCAVA
jgi:hypothetical protein